MLTIRLTRDEITPDLRRILKSVQPGGALGKVLGRAAANELKRHFRELAGEDWDSVLRGPATGDTIRRSRTQSGAAALEVWTPREKGYLLKVYRVTRTNLALHTMKRKNEK